MAMTLSLSTTRTAIRRCRRVSIAVGSNLPRRHERPDTKRYGGYEEASGLTIRKGWSSRDGYLAPSPLCSTDILSVCINVC
jgi:hypothetical protein